MGLFSRRRPSEAEALAAQHTAIAEFWEWWATQGHARATQAFDQDAQTSDSAALHALAEEIGARVERIAPLAFETGAGRTARHVLVVTPAGDPDLRPVAERWLAAAPPADDAFEYATWRQPVVDPSGVRIVYDGHDVALADARIHYLAEGSTLHLRMSHPTFAAMPDRARAQVTFLFLDAVVGERVVEEQIGEISWTPDRLEESVPLTDLPVLVSQLEG